MEMEDGNKKKTYLFLDFEGLYMFWKDKIMRNLFQVSSAVGWKRICIIFLRYSCKMNDFKACCYKLYTYQCISICYWYESFDVFEAVPEWGVLYRFFVLTTKFLNPKSFNLKISPISLPKTKNKLKLMM